MKIIAVIFAVVVSFQAAEKEETRSDGCRKQSEKITITVVNKNVTLEIKS